MRGKSIDNEFVSEFIQECTLINKTTPEEICNEAINRIEEINKQLKIRIKLNDILSFFNYKKKYINTEKTISFDLIDKSCSSIIINIISSSATINSDELFSRLSNYNEEIKHNIIFTLKQMIEAKIIYKNKEGKFGFGANFNTFNEQKI